MNSNPVNWFEIPVDDLNRAKSFYENVFGYQLEYVKVGNDEMMFFPMADNAVGAGGSLIKGAGCYPSHTGSRIYFSVADIDEISNKVNSNGGKVLIKKMSIGEFGFVAQFEDTEGNRIGLHSNA